MTATPKFSTGPIIKSDDTTRMCIYEAGLGTIALANIADDTRSDTYDQDKADDIAKAEFIVRACNEYEPTKQAMFILGAKAERLESENADLVKALQDARSHIETYGAAADDVDGTKLTPQAAEAIAAISAALAKVSQ